MMTINGIRRAEYLYDRDSEGKKSIRKSNMTGPSKVLTILLSIIIGALIGGAVASAVLNEKIGPMIDARLADASSRFVQTSGIDSSVGPTGLLSNSGTGLVPSVALDQAELAVTSVYQKISPAVVHVNTVEYVRTWFFQEVPQEGMGSGFIFNEKGYILTNNHVIEGAQTINVRLADGEEYEAELVGTDQMTDLAVLHIKGDIEIKPEWIAPLGDSDVLQVGQRAIAIGNPFGLDSTVTVGVISALERPVSTAEVMYDSMIQTDASINPGNSGGPLINSAGQVIGINTVILSQSGGSHGIGFAIPINSAKIVVDDLVTYGRVRRPALGFNGLNLYPALSQALGLSVNSGVLVQEVDTNSAFGLAGLRGGTTITTLRDRFRQYQLYGDGDIITAMNGEKVTEISTFADKIRRMELGDEITLTIVRQGAEIELKVTLAE